GGEAMRRLAVLMLGLLLVVAAPAGPATAQAPRVFQCESEDLAAAKQKLQAGDNKTRQFVQDLRRDADKALEAGPFLVPDKSETPPSGDKHDYMSLSPYWWP